MLSETAIYDALRNVQEPELGRDIVTLNMVKDVAISGGADGFVRKTFRPSELVAAVVATRRSPAA